METDPVAMPDAEATVIESGFQPQFDEPAPAKEVPAAVLRVMAGADKGRVFALPLGQGIIGRGADCDVVLADIAVSRRHCAFNFDGQAVALTDQGSGNGTKINGVRVKTQTLNHGDTIGLGKTELQFEIGGQPVQTSAPVMRPATTPVAAAAPVAAVAAAPVAQPPATSAPAPDPGAYGGMPVAASVAPQPAIPQSMLEANQTAQVAPLAPPAVGLEASADLPSVDAGVGVPDVQVKVKIKPGGIKAIYDRLTDTKQKKMIFFGVAGLLGFFLLLGIITSFMGPKAKKRKRKPVATAPKERTPEQVFNQASAHIKAKQWTKALALLKELQAHDPKSKVYNDNATFVENNIKANAVLEKARQAIRGGKLGRAELRITDDFLGEKRFLDKGTCKIALETCKAARRLARRLRYMKAAPKLAEARELAETAKKKRIRSVRRRYTAQAMEKVREALKVAPEAYPIQKLRQELGGAPPTARPDPELDRILADKNDPNAGGDQGAGTGVAVGSYGGMPASAKSLYQAQDFAGAVREINAAATKRGGAAAKKLQKIASAVSSLATSLKNGSANMALNPASAVGHFRNALAYDAGLGGAHQAMIKGKLFRVAKANASLLFSQGKYGDCYRAVNLAAQYGSEGLGRLREQLAAKAKQIFEQGYVIRTSNGTAAKNKWRQVLRMVPPSSLTYKKAVQHLNRLGAGGRATTAPMRYAPRRRYTPPRRRYTPPRRRYTPPRRRRTRPRRRPPRRRYFVGGGDEDEDE